MPVTVPQSNPSPDEALAATITDAIRDADLITAQKLPQVQSGLAKGTLTAVDWKLLADFSLPSEQGGKQS
jgi:hypothetical protein